MPSVGGLDIDHLFLAVSRGGPEVQALVDAGFAEGPPNTHPGQGTAGRRFFFAHSYLEFVWIENLEEVTSEVVGPTALGARLGPGSAASRIGVCVRLPPEREPPIPTWRYRPPYLPAGMSISMASNSAHAAEPLLFFMSAARGRSAGQARHPNGAEAISRVAITLPSQAAASPEMSWLAAVGLARVTPGDSEALRVELDEGRHGRAVRVDAATPLEVAW